MLRISTRTREKSRQMGRFSVGPDKRLPIISFRAWLCSRVLSRPVGAHRNHAFCWIDFVGTAPRYSIGQNGVDTLLRHYYYLEAQPPEYNLHDKNHATREAHRVILTQFSSSSHSAICITRISTTYLQYNSAYLLPSLQCQPRPGTPRGDFKSALRDSRW